MTDTIEHGGGSQGLQSRFWVQSNRYQSHTASSHITINGRVGSTGDPVEEDGGVPLHEEEGDPGPGMADTFTLFSPRLSSHCLGNLCHFLLS